MRKILGLLLTKLLAVICLLQFKTFVSFIITNFNQKVAVCEAFIFLVANHQN
jgi:hypothetical protein